RVAPLPPGLDPDEFSRTQGSGGARALIGSARGLLAPLIEVALDARLPAPDPRARAPPLRQVAALLAQAAAPAGPARAARHADHGVARLGVPDARTCRALRATVERALRAPAGPDGAGPAGTSDRRARSPQKEFAPPQRARSRARLDAIEMEIVGALLDFPELLDKPEILAYADHVEGDLAAALAALRQAALQSTAGGGSVPHLQAALAKMPLSIQPFAVARMAAPWHQRVSEADAALVGSLRKLQHDAPARLAPA